MHLRHSLIAALLASSTLLAGCVKNLDHSTIAVAALGAGSPPTISGATLQECVSDARLQAKASDVATFDPAFSGHFAKSVFYQGGGLDVSSLRTYALPYDVTNLFGVKGRASLACLYDFRGGGLVYLTYLRVDKDGNVDLDDIQREGKESYHKLRKAGRVVPVRNPREP